MEALWIALSFLRGNVTPIFPTSEIIQLNPMCRDRKFFLCTGQAVAGDQLARYPGSHILGELRYLVDEGRKVTALSVYEISRFVTDPPKELPEIRAEIIGDARRIKCTWCEKRERWEIGKAAIELILRKYQPE